MASVLAGLRVEKVFSQEMMREHREVDFNSHFIAVLG